MGAEQSGIKGSNRLSTKTLKDLSEKSNLTQEEIKAAEAAYIAKYPNGLPKNKLSELMQTALPKLSQQEVV